MGQPSHTAGPRPRRRTLIVVDGCELSVAAGEGCGNAGEQQIEEAVQFGGAVVGGQGGRQRTQLREFGDREPVKTEPEPRRLPS